MKENDEGMMRGVAEGEGKGGKQRGGVLVLSDLCSDWLILLTPGGCGAVRHPPGRLRK